VKTGFSISKIAAPPVIVHLQPMAWRSDGWPTMGTGVANDTASGEPVLTHAKPRVPTAPRTAPASSDEFNTPQLGLPWQWQANPPPACFSLTAQPGSLRLAAVAVPAAPSLYNAPHLLLQKFPAPAFTATTALDFSGARVGDEAGLIVFGYSYAWLGLRHTSAGRQLVQITHLDAHQSPAPIESASLAATAAQVRLRVTVSADAKCRFAYSFDGHAFTAFGSEFQATVAKWVGAKVGLFASAASASATPGHADFDYFRITP
jgi:beta-xylosidase